MSTTTAASSPARVLPRGPTSPVWWQLVRFAGDPLGLLDECRRRYGDAFTLDVAGDGPFVMLSNPETVREVFRADPEVLHSGEANAIFIAAVGRQSVLVLDEAPHARQRRVLAPPLKGERMRAFFDAMRLETLEAARAWPRDAPFPALPTMRRITLRVILRTALGMVPGPEMDRFEGKIERLLSHGRQRYALVLIVPRLEVVDRLADELRRVTGGGPPEADQLPALEYLDAAIRESLRRNPVAPFVVRKTVRPFAVGGREYPSGVVLCPCSYLVHRREDLYPEPDRFRPERFLERKFGPHEWFPFGGGNRVCLGMPFALYEMKVLLATLFSQVRLARPGGARSRAGRYGIVLGPDDGARVIVRGATAWADENRA
ncbi:MAG: cytochrome P450 [Isosphaeraceae bacterium]